MTGEFDSPSKPTTSEYRDGWDRLYRFENHPMHERDGQNIRLTNIQVPESAPDCKPVSYATYKSVFQLAMEEITGYPNGCPILDDTKAS